MTEKQCAFCGKAFQGYEKSRYCSEECRIMNYRRKNGLPEILVLGKRQYEVQCSVCGKPFIAGRSTAKYCSDCRHESQKKVQRAYAARKAAERREFREQKAKEKGKVKKPKKKPSKEELQIRFENRKARFKAAQEWLDTYRKAPQAECEQMIADAIGISLEQYRSLHLMEREQKRAEVLQEKREVARVKGGVYEPKTQT